VTVCAACGRESPDDFGFCPGCGAALTAVPAREVRKVVTVLFCDLTGSTAMGERSDPEALRALMNRYYDTARGVLERHGGTVEKFVGDAVMAVFGIPVASEDDALRATRAAVELRAVVQELGLDARIGVNTGAVVAGEGDTLVTGDAVNVAARLEQAAGEGEILLGEDTLRLVRDAITADGLELTLKGKSEPVPAYRLRTLDVQAVGVARRLERPMVGRERERARLRADFDDVVGTSSCRLFTLIGPAGIGKSRLVADFLEHVGDHATVAGGRALSYGEGITYWPLVEMLVQLGIEPSEAIRSSPAETQLATRALLEERARERPLVLVVDDLHWAEEPMLDLVEHVVDWSRAAPILVLCVARPELLDIRPGWGGGKLNATSILLEPLPDSEARRLADGLLLDVELDEETRARILATADGNPLFLEEMAALAREANGSVDVPPTIRALLQARLDALNDDERVVVERGAVEGQVFHRGAVTALAPASPRVDVPDQLLSLVRKEVVRPDQAVIAGDDAFRFRHLLIRDTAYEGLPKAVRAELHERFADWLEANVELVEQDEILGYHLERAARYRTELDADDASASRLAGRAARHLGKAGRGALGHGDLHAANNLLRRALALAPDDEIRRRLIPYLADTLIEQREDVDEVDRLLDELGDGDAHDRALAHVLRLQHDPAAGDIDVRLARLDEAHTVLGDAGDTLGLVRCERARGWVYWSEARFGAAHIAYRRALELQRQAGSRVLHRELVFDVCISSSFAGATVEEGRRLFDELEPEAEAAGPLLVTALRAFRARLGYLAGELDDVALRAATDDEMRLLEETGASEAAIASSRYFLDRVVPWIERDPMGVEAGTRRWVDETANAARHVYHANALGSWAIALCDLGEHERALTAVREARELADPNDVADQIVLDQAEAYALALSGESARAQTLLERARERAATIDLTSPQDNPLHSEARVLRELGDTDGARRLLGSLVELCRQRGLHRAADRYHLDLVALESSDRD
jgi:class 3 adenylate cyclase/tetratricopeptide (TPR) repeat protein